MSRKTRKQKLQSAERKKKVVEVTTVLTTKQPQKAVSKYTNRFQYKETDYDKELRKYTIQDIMKTSVIIVSLFVLQYIIYLKFAPTN